MADDLIRRQAAIDLFKEWQPRLATNVSEFGDALRNLPSAPQWTPASERLPKESDGKVLITVSGEVETGRYSEFSKTWYIGDMNGVGGDDPVAWMPLPKPCERSDNERFN